MRDLALKLWLWTKVIVGAVIALYVLTFVVKNRDYSAELWYWVTVPNAKMSVLTLAFCAFAAGVVVTLLVRTILKTARQLSNLHYRRQTAKLERKMSELSEMQAKAAALQKAETKVDAGAPLGE